MDKVSDKETSLDGYIAVNELNMTFIRAALDDLSARVDNIEKQMMELRWPTMSDQEKTEYLDKLKKEKK